MPAEKWIEDCPGCGGEGGNTHFKNIGGGVEALVCASCGHVGTGLKGPAKLRDAIALWNSEAKVKSCVMCMGVGRIKGDGPVGEDCPRCSEGTP